MKVSSYLDSKGFDYEVRERPSGTNFIMICPFCGGGEHKKRSFAINATTGLWNCKRENNCGESGTFYQLQQRLGDKPVKIDPHIYNNPFKKEKVYTKPKVIKIPLSDISLKYLMEERCFTKEIIEHFDLFEGLDGKVKIPFYKNKSIVNIKSRSKYGKEEGDILQCKNAEPTLYNIDSVKGTKLLIIVEGEYDCIALTQYGLVNVVSIPSGANDQRWIEHEWDFLNTFEEIFINMDDDKAGQGSVMKLVNRLGIWRCKSVTLPYKDANECLKEKVSPEEILQCFKDAEEFIPPEIRPAGDFCEEVMDIFRNPDRYNGVDTGIPELTKILRGWRDGELTLWSGQNHSGKSTMLNQCCLLLGHRGIRCCVASLELRPARYLKWAVEQACGKNNPTEEEVIKAFEWMNEWFYVLNIEDRVEGKKILELFEYTARKYGIKHFIIDSLMKVKTKEGDMGQADFVQDYRNFGQKFGVHTHLVAHPRKQETDKDEPDKVDVKGRGEIVDIADNCIIMWRNLDKEKEDLEEYEVNSMFDGAAFIKKNREFGTLGSIGLYFYPESRRFLCKSQTDIFN